ncbi:MAG: S41 family peptidase [Phycisphaerae bacterium]
MRPGTSCLVSILLACCVMVGACASPAKPQRASGGTEVGGRAPLDGEYDVELHSTWFGPIRTRMTAQAMRQDGGRSSFKANTRPGIAWTLVGGLAETLGPVLTPYLFPQGMLLTWESTMPSTDGKPGEGWIGISRVGPFGAKTLMRTAEGPVEIVFTDGRLIAVMTLRRREVGTPPPMADYPALTDAIRKATMQSLFDPAVANGDDLKAYFDDVAQAATVVQDDLEYTFAGGLAWRKRPRLPLPLAYRPVNEESKRLVKASPAAVQPMRLTVDPLTGVATIEVLAFADAELVDEIFSKTLAARPKGIILDLRSCTGFDLAALRAACWLLSGRHEAGRFVAAAQRESSPAEDLRVDLDSAAAVNAAHATLRDRRRASVSVVGEDQGYGGPLAVLTLGRTRSSAEVLGWLLRQRPDTRFFGARTAGRPRIDFEKPLEQGFVIRIPEFEWQAPGGKVGECEVTPDERCPKDRAPAAAAAWLTKRAAASAS